MHKLYDFACKELKALEDKTDKGLTATELEYAMKLIEMKKGILKIEMLEDGGNSYESGYSRDRGGYSRRDNAGMNRYAREYRPYWNNSYSMATEEIVSQLEDMMDTAPDEPTRREISKLIHKMHNH